MSSHFNDVVDLPEPLPSGTWKCGNCNYREWVLENQGPVPAEWQSTSDSAPCGLSNGRDCIEIVFCECGMLYVGKTKHQFWRRIKDPVFYGRYNQLSTSTSRHIILKHKNYPTVLKFAALEHIMPSPRGDNWDRTILQGKCR